MVEKRLLALILLIEHKLILIVARSVNDELQVSRLPTHFLGQLAQDRLDLLALTVTRTPVGYDYVSHDLLG